MFLISTAFHRMVEMCLHVENFNDANKDDDDSNSSFSAHEWILIKDIELFNSFELPQVI